MKKSVLFLALALSMQAWTVSAQDAAPPPARGPGGPGGGGRGGFGGGPGNFDPAQLQQMILDNYREQLAVANDDEWAAIQVLIQKVLDAQQEAQQFGGRGGRGGLGGPGGPGGFGGRGGPGGFAGRGDRFGGPPNPAVEALQAAIESNSKDELKTAIAKYREARKQAQEKLAAAQDAFKKVLTLRQEAMAIRLGLIN